MRKQFSAEEAILMATSNIEVEIHAVFTAIYNEAQKGNTSCVMPFNYIFSTPDSEIVSGVYGKQFKAHRLYPVFECKLNLLINVLKKEGYQWIVDSEKRMLSVSWYPLKPSEAYGWS